MKSNTNFKFYIYSNLLFMQISTLWIHFFFTSKGSYHSGLDHRKSSTSLEGVRKQGMTHWLAAVWAFNPSLEFRYPPARAVQWAQRKWLRRGSAYYPSMKTWVQIPRIQSKAWLQVCNRNPGRSHSKCSILQFDRVVISMLKWSFPYFKI